MLQIFNSSIVFDFLINLHCFCENLVSQLETNFIFDALIVGAIIMMANRLSDKVLKGLQRTAATTIIARGAYDAYNSLTDKKAGGSSDPKDSDKGSDKDSGKDSDKDSGKDSDKDKNKDSNKDSGKDNNKTDNKTGSNNNSNNGK
jgi:hypothetical protein